MLSSTVMSLLALLVVADPGPPTAAGSSPPYDPMVVEGCPELGLAKASKATPSQGVSLVLLHDTPEPEDGEAVKAYAVSVGKAKSLAFVVEDGPSECLSIPIGKAESRLWGTFVPGPDKTKAYVLEHPTACSDELCVLALAVRTKAGVVIDAVLLDTLPSQQAITLEALDLFGDGTSSILVTWGSGMDTGWDVNQAIYHLFDGKLTQLFRGSVGSVQLASPGEVEEGSWKKETSLGTITVQKKGKSPVVEVLEAVIGKEYQLEDPAFATFYDDPDGTNGTKRLAKRQAYTFDPTARKLVPSGKATIEAIQPELEY